MNKPSIAPDADALIKRFGLQPHPEGGYYRESFRDTRLVQTEAGPRNASTCIYYLLERGAFSAWHRIAGDELWHFYAGSPLLIHVMTADGGFTTHRLGNALHDADAAFQVCVPARHWFAAELENPQEWALVGCTVAPGFEFSEFELAPASELLSLAPERADLIKRLASPLVEGPN